MALGTSTNESPLLIYGDSKRIDLTNPLPKHYKVVRTPNRITSRFREWQSRFSNHHDLATCPHLASKVALEARTGFAGGLRFGSRNFAPLLHDLLWSTLKQYGGNLRITLDTTWLAAAIGLGTYGWVGNEDRCPAWTSRAVSRIGMGHLNSRSHKLRLFFFTPRVVNRLVQRFYHFAIEGIR